MLLTDAVSQMIIARFGMASALLNMSVLITSYHRHAMPAGRAFVAVDQPTGTAGRQVLVIHASAPSIHQSAPQRLQR